MEWSLLAEIHYSQAKSLPNAFIRDQLTAAAFGQDEEDLLDRALMVIGAHPDQPGANALPARTAEGQATPGWWSAGALLATLKAVAELRRRWRSQDEAETIDSLEYMDGLDALELDAVIAEAATVQPRPAGPRMRAALTWLLDDLTDAGEDRDPETGVEYDSVAFARAALTGASPVRPASKPAASANHNPD